MTADASHPKKERHLPEKVHLPFMLSRAAAAVPARSTVERAPVSRAVGKLRRLSQEMYPLSAPLSHPWLFCRLEKFTAFMNLIHFTALAVDCVQ
ncbi:hypothetical protein [Chachezhania sediminis]|uniref:hypothetical protein n=1 Tax=Chachezhania sediminis TaxID=2599291 RepID=UPI0018EED201|nr:hypothetical protein [Chachezhania sediminis]